MANSNMRVSGQKWAKKIPELKVPAREREGVDGCTRAGFLGAGSVDADIAEGVAGGAVWRGFPPLGL